MRHDYKVSIYGSDVSDVLNEEIRVVRTLGGDVIFIIDREMLHGEITT